jgi:hypothetical protein
MDDIQWLKKIGSCVEAGYKAEERQDAATASRLWLSCWKEVVTLMEERRIASIGEFDRLFPSEQPLFNWAQDLEMALGNAAQGDPGFHERRIAFCTEIIPLLDPEPGDPIRENMRRAVADSHAGLGQLDIAVAMYRDWLGQDPRWGFGWIGLSWLYTDSRSPTYDPGEAERILLEGLAIRGVMNRPDLLNNLGSCRVDMTKAGKHAKGNQGGSLPATRLPGQRSPWDIQPGLKIGRNEACPCGSGKKYKRCCGA